MNFSVRSSLAGFSGQNSLDSQMGKTSRGERITVDEIFVLKVPGKNVVNAFNLWFKKGEPSGGPEQFLSPELKKAILKAVTDKLVKIPQEVFDKIK